eukprot:1162113-Pelagomonas_calceolata.AAC.10
MGCCARQQLEPQAAGLSAHAVLGTWPAGCEDYCVKGGTQIDMLKHEDAALPWLDREGPGTTRTEQLP